MPDKKLTPHGWRLARAKCLGLNGRKPKQQHSTYQLASDEAQRLRKFGYEVRPYPCPIGEHFHVGHVRKAKK